MGRKRKCQRRDDSSSSSDSSSCDDEMCSPATTPIRTSESLAATEKRRNTRRREDKGIKQILKELKEDRSEMRKQLKIFCEINDDTREIRKQVKKLTESQNELRKYLVDHINGSSGDDSAAPRSESSEVQPPRYRLEFTCKVNNKIEKGEIIKTNHGEIISVALHDDHKQIVETGPLASATVMLVVVNGEFNQHGNQYNWLRKDFERSIKGPPQRNSAVGDVNNQPESIVSDCIFKLEGGVKNHTGATILYNSSNRKVRLGVMLLSPTEERVLEGLSNPFFVRGHDRTAKQSNPHCNGSKRQKQALVGYDCPERNDPMLYMQNASPPILTQPGEIITVPNTNILSTEASISASRWQEEVPLLTMYGDSMDQAISSLPGTQFNMNQTALPVQLVWDRPNVGLRNQSWNILDQLMPLYSCPPKFSYSCLPTVHLGSLTSTPKYSRKKGVLIEPLEPEDSDAERPMKNRKLQSKYRLQFVNNVCEAYYTWEKIKASDGDLLKVSLFDENNMRITSGPLSSASVEVVVLHGDFNVDGQHYWTSEEFSGCVVCPDKTGKEAPVLAGNRFLTLVDGEACICDALFQITSRHARTGRFKMGVVQASVHDERIQEGISEPFRVRERHFEGLPPGFCFHPTSKELILHYLLKRVTAVPLPVNIIAEVNIYEFNPWDLPGKALYGEREWYFFSPWDPNVKRRAAGSGYWMGIGTDKPITSESNRELGFKRTFCFYKGCVPNGSKTNWFMNMYRLVCDLYNTNKDSQFTSNMQVDKMVLCRIYEKPQLSLVQSATPGQSIYQQKQQLSTSTDEEDLSQPVQYYPFPGFRFHPTDEELILHYLRNRAASLPCPVSIIADVDIYKFDPWDLPDKAVYGNGEWYFFSPGPRKYPNSVRPNRAAGSGYWKATGTDKPIHDAATGHIVGVKKALVFYKGRPPKGTKTNWIMYEYRLNPIQFDGGAYRLPVTFRGVSTTLEDWFLNRILYKKIAKDHHKFVTEKLDPLTDDQPLCLQNIADHHKFVTEKLDPLTDDQPLCLQNIEDLFEHHHVATAEPSERILQVKTTQLRLSPTTDAHGSFGTKKITKRTKEGIKGMQPTLKMIQAANSE